MNRILKALLVLGALLTVPSPSGHASDLTFQGGFGYDFFSQEYFLSRSSWVDSLNAVGPDSALAEWELTKNYLDDFKVQLGLDYVASGASDWRLQLSYEQTGEFIRPRLNGELTASSTRGRYRLGLELEGRSRYRGETDFGDDYFEGRLRNRLTVPLGPVITAKAQVDFELVRFRHAATYSYDYTRISSRLGTGFVFEGGSYADLALFAKRREVPDSSDLAYLNLGVDGSLFAYYPAGELDLFAAVGRKTYDQVEDRDDHWRAELDARNRLRIGQSWFSRQELELEAVRYDGVDPVNRDYTRLGVAVTAGLDMLPLTLALGPEIDLLTEREDAFDIGDDYFESGLRLDLDLLIPGAVLLSGESSTGFRDQRREDDFQSDFVFERVMLIADLQLAGHLGLNVLLSADWEWHEQSADDTRTALFSSSLTYTF